MHQRSFSRGKNPHQAPETQVCLDIYSGVPEAYLKFGGECPVHCERREVDGVFICANWLRVNVGRECLGGGFFMRTNQGFF